MSLPLRAVLAAMVAVGLAVPARAGDWSTHAGDAARSGVASAPVDPPLRLAWSFRTPLPPQPAWPEAAKWDGWHRVWDLETRMTFDRTYHVVGGDGVVYFGSSSSDQVYALDAATGTKRWSVFTEGPVRLAPVVADGRVWFGSDDGLVYCVSADDGAVLWTRRPAPSDQRLAGNERLISAWPVRGGLALMDGLLYGAAGVFPSETVYVFALDATTGNIVWTTSQSDLPAQGYLLASPTKLYVPSGRNNPIVFDRATGRRERVVEGHGGSYCLLYGDQLIFGPGRAGELGLVDEGETDQLASFAGLHMLVTPDVAYLQSRRDLRALDRPRFLELAREKRSFEARRAKVSEGLELLGKKPEDNAEAIAKLREQAALLGAEIDRRAEAMEASYRWTVVCDAPHAMILAGSSIFAGGDGRISARDAVDGEESWSAELEGKVLGLAAIEGRLYASTDLGTVSCFEEVER